MARKNRSLEENARREKIRELLRIANIDGMEDIQNLFKETISEFMEAGLEVELDEKLGYSRYDYKRKTTDHVRNGHSSKTLRTSFGNVAVSVALTQNLTQNRKNPGGAETTQPSGFPTFPDKKRPEMPE